MEKKLNVCELFSVCTHNQEVLKTGAQDIAEERPLQEIWSNLDPNDD